MLCPVLSWHTQRALHAHALLNSSGKAFSETPMGSSATWAHLTKYLRQYGMYNGQSVIALEEAACLQHKEVHQATHDGIRRALPVMTAAASQVSSST